MLLNDLPPGVRVYGDPNWRGNCPTESIEQVTFFAQLRREYPDTWGLLALHPRNEQQLRQGQFAGVSRQKAEGMTPGAADIVIPGAPAFVCELKRRDGTQSTWQPGQVGYLGAAARSGAFVCVALGWAAAWEGLGEWLTSQVNK